MNAESPICPICSKPRNPNVSSPHGHCNGHARPNLGSTSKQRLDAIRSANPSANPKPGDGPPAPGPKEQLDALPTPGWAAPPAANTGVSLKEQLDAIPGPGGSSSLKGQLDAIPSPGAGAQPASSSLKDQLDAIPGPAAAPAMKGQLDAIPTPSALKGGAPTGGGLLGRKKTTASADISSLKGIAKQEPVSAPGAGISKSALDAIPAPGSGGGQAGYSKDVLDSIPTPGAGATAADTGAGARISKTALDAIPSPGAGAASAGIPKDLLDSIPTPGSGAGIPKDALDAIPSPGMGHHAEAPSSQGGAGLADQLDAIPTPRAAGGGGARTDGEVPQWMKNFEQHQSSISASISPTQSSRPQGGYAQQGSQGGEHYGSAPNAVPDSYRSPIQRGNGSEGPPENSPYTTIIGVVILVCIVVVGIMMAVKPTANLSTPSNSSTPSIPSSTSSPSSTSNPSTPGALPGSVPLSSP